MWLITIDVIEAPQRGKKPFEAVAAIEDHLASYPDRLDGIEYRA